MALRILLVTRRFWPLCTPADARLLELADGWRRAGAQVSVVTPQWEKTWPLRLVVREIPVTRLAYSPKRLWGGYWYLRRLTKQLAEMAKKIDLIVVAGLQLDLLAATRVGHEAGVPVVALYQSGDVAQLHASRHQAKLLDSLRQTAALVASTSGDETEAASLRLSQTPCVRLEFPLPLEEPTSRERSAARMHLLESNRDFFTTPATPVVLTTAPLEDLRVLHHAFGAFSGLRDVHTDARFWWIGDGPRRTSLYSLLGEYEIRYHAVLPGDFDDPSDLLAAASVYFAPSAGAGAAIRRALAAGLPVIAADLPEIRSQVPEGAPVRFYPPGDDYEATRHLCRVVDQPNATEAWAKSCYEWAAQFQAADAAARHLAYFEELCGRPR